MHRAVLLGSLLLVSVSVIAIGTSADSLLIEAVKRSDAASVRRRIAQRDNVNEPAPDGTTALHWAAESDNAEIVDLLLAAGARAGTANRYGMTPLHLAAVNGNPVVLEKLLKAGADPNAVLPEGETVLMTAARTGSPETVAVLLDHGADIDARENWYGETALMWAASQNHAEAVQLLIDRGASADSRSSLRDIAQRRNGQSIMSLGSWTPLMYAARENAIDAGRALTKAGAALDLVDPDGATALVLAIINAHYEFAAMLLEAGADPNVSDTEAGMGPLYAAADMHRLAVGHGRPNPKPAGPMDAVEIARLLLQHGADPNARLRKAILQRHHTAGDSSLGEGATPFMRAAKSGDVAMMRVLLALGADPKLTMPNGTTALMYAAGSGWRNGSPAAPSYDQGSEEEAVEAIRLLLDADLDIGATTENGDTALHMAVSGRASEAIVKALVELGADPDAKNGRGQTPLSTAKSRDNEALVHILSAASP